MRHSCISLDHLHDTIRQGEQFDLRGQTPFLTDILSGYLSAQPTWKHILFVLPRARDIASWHQNLETLAPHKKIYNLPFPQLWGLEKYQNLVQVRHQRIQALYHLANQKPGLYLTTWTSLLWQTIHFEDFKAATLHLKEGRLHQRDHLVKSFIELGYTESRAVHQHGQYLLRGGVLEIFPMHMINPVRINFFDDEISHIQIFSAQDRQIIEQINSCEITPAYERSVTPQENAIQKIFDDLMELKVPRAIREGILLHLDEKTPFQGYEQYLPLLRNSQTATHQYIPKDTLWIFPHSQTFCEQSHHETSQQFTEHFEDDKKNQKPAVHPEQHLSNSRPTIKQALHIAEGTTTNERTSIHWEKSATPLPLKPQNFESFWETLDWLQTQEACCLFYGNADQIHRITKLLENRDYEPQQLISPWSPTATDKFGIYTAHANVPAGWHWFESENKLLLSLDYIFGRQTIASKHHKKLTEYLTSLKELHVHDIVVHPKHGMGQYLGTHHFSTADGTTGDYLELLYQNNVRMYVPVEDIQILNRYGSAGSAQIDKIHGASWQQKKSKAKKAIHDLAEELLALQAKRITSHPIQLSHQDESLYQQFENDFPWQETDDQLRSLQEIDHDLTSGEVMDRLLVGDVGFGKTEIAIRSAMKAVLSGYQVIVLVPTTILCQQHERTFHHRMGHYGVQVKRLDRTIKGAHAQKLIQDFKDQQCDVLIATHRILSKAWPMEHVGLVIVDEEQRFGVSHKEKLKSLRSNVHILSMTATPIPRTLHMSMIGLRQISLIETPPKNRRSVQTEVRPFAHEAIREAIHRELDRDGQIFVIYNRVTDIERVRQELNQIAPEASITIAHGQMPEASLDRAISGFLDRQSSILLCTTIVESGIDMPNVNTLIVYEAERFGLSQLHQIRGRVGRSDLQAFALFLTRKDLSHEAQERLDSLIHHQELNAGFAIASQDLEQRGAGDLLGSKQSGHVGAIGLALYTNMLEQAISELKGNHETKHVETELLLGIKPVIPRDYIKTDLERLKNYRRIFESPQQAQQEPLRVHLEETYGPLPPDMHNLFILSRIRFYLGSLGVTRAKKVQDAQILLYFQKGRLQTALQHLQPSAAYEVTSTGELSIQLSNPAALLNEFEGALIPLMQTT